MAKTQDELVAAVLALVRGARHDLRTLPSPTTLDQRDRIRLEAYYQISSHVQEFDRT